MLPIYTRKKEMIYPMLFFTDRERKTMGIFQKKWHIGKIAKLLAK